MISRNVFSIKPVEQILSDIWQFAELPLKFRQSLESQIYVSLTDLSDSKVLTSRPVLPAHWCFALGGYSSQAAPIVVIGHLLLRASDLIDQIQDKQLANQEGRVNLSINSAVGLIFCAQIVLNNLERYGCSEATARAIQQRFSQQLLQISGGQYLDIVSNPSNLANCWEVVRMKSALPVGLLFWSAARLVSDQESILNASEQLGQQLGLLIQIGDDWQDLWSNSTDLSDIRTGIGASVPISYTVEVLSGTQLETFKGHLKAAQQVLPAAEVAETAARDIVLQSGADLYLTVKLQEFGSKALEIINSFAPDELELKTIITKLMNPQWAYKGHFATGYTK